MWISEISSNPKSETKKLVIAKMTERRDSRKDRLRMTTKR